LKLGLVQYISGMIEELEEALLPYKENLNRDYLHPAAKWLFTVKPDTEELVTHVPSPFGPFHEPCEYVF